MAARFHGCPKNVRKLFEEIDDGQGRTPTASLAAGLKELGACGVPPLVLPEIDLQLLCGKFDFDSTGKIVLRDFAKAMTAGRLPSPRTRSKLVLARSPSPERPPRRRKKKAPANVESMPILAAAPAPAPAQAEKETLWGKALSRKATRHLVSQADLVASAVRAKKKETPEVNALYNQALELKRKSARAAALMIAALREKANSNNGQLTKLQFNEAMVDLGVLYSVDDNTDVLFDSVDMDHSGIISINELEEAVRHLVDPSMVSELENLLKEGASISTSIQSLRDKLASQASRVIDLFQKWDTNHDGNISRDEFLRAMPFLGLQHCLPVEVNALFTAFDPDGSGEISFRELHRMLRQVGSPRKKVVVEEPKMPPVDVDALRKETKLDVIKMNMKIEFQDIVMIRKMALKKKSKKNTMDLYQTLNDDDLFGQPDGIDILPQPPGLWKVVSDG